MKKIKDLNAQEIFSIFAEKMTESECKVIEQLLSGKNTNQIAEHAFLSERTVRTHISNVMKKINAHSRLDLVLKIDEIMKEKNFSSETTETECEKIYKKQKLHKEIKKKLNKLINIDFDC